LIERNGIRDPQTIEAHQVEAIEKLITKKEVG